ncbi:Cell wall integrity and stress response component 4 [Cytospora mali]|uniref:Cell wall integrity and stress response component 4 n=1 Tax=Cytospora mali TaxID=578113 RepID=A0A194UT58_CYTMA|nr:Cell wall integrity and stress response component 4 [Valsa mali var. pyri (nom. inval.)]
MILGFAAANPSIAVAYCASINTGQTTTNTSIYQSEGLCYDFCNDQSYALGVLKGSDCWCSNYVPDTDDQVDTSKCDTSCPGYPDDYCGGDDLYGYIALDSSPKGTTGGSTTATSTSKTKTDSVTTTSTSATPTSTSSISLTSDKSSKTTTTSAPESTTSTTEPTEAAQTTSQKNTGGTPTTITSVQTVTSAGTIIIQTITSISTPSSKSSGNGLTKGAIAGLTVGILAAVAAFILGAFLFRRHKRSMQPQNSMPGGGIDRRGSSAGIMSKAGTISSSGYGLAMEEDGSYGTPGRRMSMKPMDPRLDPKVGLYRVASHDSLNTIRDDQDYSRRVHEAPRVMRVTNPDPDPAD